LRRGKSAARDGATSSTNGNGATLGFEAKLAIAGNLSALGYPLDRNNP
jgi:hypothetical protein